MTYPYELPAQILEQTADQYGRSLKTLTEKPILLVFLRHFGCTFCREAVSDLKSQEPRLLKQGILPALVHMSAEESAAAFLARYRADTWARFSDPNQRLYESFGLGKGTFAQVFGFKSWVRGLEAGILGAHGIGLLEGNGFRMPGVFLLHKGAVHRAFVHQSVADRPDYCELSNLGPLS